MSTSANIVGMTAAHTEAVLAIYQEGIDTGKATFATTAVDWTTFDTEHLPEHR